MKWMSLPLLQQVTLIHRLSISLPAMAAHSKVGSGRAKHSRLSAANSLDEGP
jgi:hypothetical protein